MSQSGRELASLFDRRRHPRTKLASAVAYSLEDDVSPKLGNTTDISGGGLRLATDEDLPFGSVLLLRFALPTRGRTIAARGRIVISYFEASSKQFQHGVTFTRIDPADQRDIVSFVMRAENLEDDGTRTHSEAAST